MSRFHSVLFEELRLKYSCAVCLLLVCLFVQSAACQSTDATVSGLVVDASGHVIASADVEILNEETGVHYPSKTNGAGIYMVPILPPGQYLIQVSKAGFKTVIKPGVVLNVQSALSLNFTLPVGAVSESVTVEAGASLINTTDASVSTVIDRKFVENIPLNGRSFQDLISLTPGVVTQSPQAKSTVGNNGDFSVNGQRTESNYYTVDGVSANTNPGNGNGFAGSGTGGTLPGATALGTTQTLISVDALQEFRVMSSTYSAEFGRAPGGQFSLATRSGTNQVRGSAFDYLRNNFFDANDWFNDHNRKAQTPLRQNDFGGTVGGPIWIPHLYEGRNRSFFFASYEGLRLTQPQAATIQYVPDSYMRQQAPAALQPILNAFPIQNGLDYGSATTPSLAQFIAPYSLPSRINATSIRLDHTFARALSVFFRFSDTPSSAGSRVLSAVSTLTGKSQTYTLGGDSALSSKLSNTLRLGYSKTDAAQHAALDSFGGAQPINLAQGMGAGGYPNAESLAYLSFSSIGFSYLSTSNSANGGRQWNLNDTVRASVGQHELRFGIDYLHIKSILSPYLPLVEAEYLSPSQVLANQAAYLFITNTVGAVPIFNDLALFAQDDWKVRPGLSLSLGLRWELAPPPNGENGSDAYTLSGNINQPSSLAVAPRGTSLWRTSWYNFAPRLGLAWQAHTNPGWETVVRAGGGVFFDTGNQVATGGFSGSSIGFGKSNSYFNAPLPATQSQVVFSPAPTAPYTDDTIFAFPEHLQLPYTLQWNGSVEQALGNQQALTLSYVASSGRRLQKLQILNLASLNPEFGSIYVYPSGVTSNYQALQVQFQRNVGHGLHALASYTWGHSIDFGSTSSERTLMRGNSDFDVRNNLAGGISWDLPSSHGNRAIGMVINDWGFDGRLTARGAFPIPLQGALQTDASTGIQYYGNVNLVPDRPLYLYGPQYPGGRALNGGPTATSPAFTKPIGSDPGNAPRNFVRGFGATQVNVALRREFPLHDRVALQFRAEAFNVFNHPNFGLVDPTLTDATFGQATQMLNQSLGTLASQYQQGGPRSMQFALKFVF
jgi:hypothetical protein